MMKSMTPSGAFGFYAAICFVGWFLIIFVRAHFIRALRSSRTALTFRQCYPEVGGLPLESIREVYSHGFGVKYASKLRKDIKQRRTSIADI